MSIRSYADTSVFGEAYDPEFAPHSVAFFQQVREGRFELAVSTLVVEELRGAPDEVNNLFAELASFVVLLDVDDAAYDLKEAYLAAKVVSANWETDALHVATATVSACRAIVSWNFKHIVNFRRISLYNEVNRRKGYGRIEIHIPPAVLYDDEE